MFVQSGLGYEGCLLSVGVPYSPSVHRPMVTLENETLFATCPGANNPTAQLNFVSFQILMCDGGNVSLFLFLVRFSILKQ